MTCDAAFRFIYSAFSAAMGCLFACFRARSDDRSRPTTHHVSEPAVSRSRRNVSSPNQFTSLLVAEERDESLCKDEPNPSSGLQKTEITAEDLQYEAKFLKASGVLVETPAEIRNSKEKLQISKEQNLDSGSPKFHSWYPTISVENLCLSKEVQDQSLKLCEEWQDASSEHSTDSFSSCAESHKADESLIVDKKSQLPSLSYNITKNQDCELDISPVINSPQIHSTAVKSRTKSVHFARETLLSCKVEMPGGAFQYSPHPTPLKLTDEMQTPGTIYAATLDSATRANNARIRSQYVYAAMNPVDSITELRMLKEEEEEEAGERNGETVVESSEHFYDTPGNSFSKKNKKLADEDINLEATLSAWLRPPPSSTKNKSETVEVLDTQNLGLTPGSRPILGVLPASYWNRDGSSDVSTKCWDGNGIPNTTTKYKEDQKVRWHATPFEERLEKALSVEGPVSNRREMDGIPIVYEDKEAEGTESVVLQSSTLHTEAGPPFIEHRIDIVS